jgi:hypothetical protein
MKRYKKLSGDTGIDAYEAGRDFIRIRFEDGGVYLYTDESTGADNIAEMKALAESGKGLCTFINTRVRGDYAVKET